MGRWLLDGGKGRGTSSDKKDGPRHIYSLERGVLFGWVGVGRLVGVEEEIEYHTNTQSNHKDQSLVIFRPVSAPRGGKTPEISVRKDTL